MKLDHIEICGFRGYRDAVRVKFGDSFTIIDGRNGVGKSTIFDAVEFALTGTISKYGDAKADGESIADYIWWSGDGGGPPERYVEVSFRGDDEGTISIRRERLTEVTAALTEPLLNKLVDTTLAPSTSLALSLIHI